jgi:glucose/arabinose dehydrogenase
MSGGRAMRGGVAALAVALGIAGCGETARLPFEAGVGPDPTLPPPNKAVIPTVHIAKAKGWPDGRVPAAAPGTAVTAFASGLDHPRWIHVLPNGDVLVAETNAPPKPDDQNGLKGRAMKVVLKKVGAAVPSANRIALLRDADGDGIAETRSVLLDRRGALPVADDVGNAVWRVTAAAPAR